MNKRFYYCNQNKHVCSFNNGKFLLLLVVVVVFLLFFCCCFCLRFGVGFLCVFLGWVFYVFVVAVFVVVFFTLLY